MNRQLEIYKTLEGEVIFDIDREQETIWATKVLKQYVVGGIAVNERRLIDRQELDVGEANGVLEILSRYAGSFKVLKEFDDGKIVFSKSDRVRKKLTGTDYEKFVMDLKNSLNEGDEFGAGDYDRLAEQVVGKNVTEQAANLLYYIVKLEDK